MFYPDYHNSVNATTTDERRYLVALHNFFKSKILGYCTKNSILFDYINFDYLFLELFVN